jgi:ABC-2 type transport system permease protein
MNTSLWFKVMKGRMMVRIWSQFGEILWIAVNIGFPLFSSLSFSLLYQSIGLKNYSGFAILGGVILSFWGNVLWSMASQFNWDKQEGLFEIYLVSPAPISAILVGMSIGGILGTAPAAFLVGLIGYLVFKPPFSVSSFPAVAMTFSLTLFSLYSLGMMLSSLYLAYGREAETLNEAIQEPVSMVSGIYFPSVGRLSPFPSAIQAVASLVPLTIGMDALRRALFFSEQITSLLYDELALGIAGTILFILSTRLMKILEKEGRERGTLTVRIL